ncbi:MAG: winged helix-turn-helix domain-containing protein [Microthrixaceae bacterium]
MTRFGDVTVDEPARELRLDGELQHLEPQAFDVLSFLLANRDRVVAKSEILDEVWGDQFVSESALTTRIKEIRRAVGDDGRTQAVIKNVRGRGYRFVAEIRDTPRSGAEDAAVGTRRPLPARRALVGRGVPSVTAVEAAESSRVVTLLGPGGVGKTSLAIDIAHQLAPARADGAFFVDLTPITDSDDVLASMRQAAGYVQVSAEQQTIESLRALDALLVIDNCEHVLDAVSSLVRVLVDETTQLSVLATSRERLPEFLRSVFVVEPSRRRTLGHLSKAQERTTWVRSRCLSGTDLEKLSKVTGLPPAGHREMAAGRLAFGLDELADLPQADWTSRRSGSVALSSGTQRSQT